MRNRIILGALAMAAIPFVARGDTLSLAQVTAEITTSSPLKLRGDVAEDFAENLLKAQAAAPYTQNEPDSLQLSIEAVIRAISLDKKLGKDHYCDDSNCSIAWGQSNIAIDDRAVVGISATTLAEAPVRTPEPTTLTLLVLAGLGLIRKKARV
jgi:hypothetical protein